MRLKRLELQGFKSFLDRTILHFESGITGVVGPNGCGKSNIVDAIQWVMGEQSAKHLRGDQMTDVIFNGSETKAPTSMAEVTLVLEKEGVPLSPTFSAFDKSDEISITRRVYRDGTGEYLINKVVCRLKDIHELFMDTGVGKRAYSIIEQGQIDRMINVKPEDRRVIFEEVAGITKYKAKKKEAEKKLEMTGQNLLRLQDIIGELEKQIRSLKVQATRARKYKELKAELETVDLFLIGRNLHGHTKAVAELKERRDTLISSRSESDARYSQLDAEVTELEIQRIDLEKAIQELSEKERDLSLLIQRLDGQLGLNAERRNNLSQSLEEGKAEEEAIQEALHRLEGEETQFLDERRQMGEALAELERQIADREARLRSQQEQRHRATQRKDALQSKKAQVSRQIDASQNQAEHGKRRQEEIREARAILNEKLTELVVAMEGQKSTILDVEKKLEACATKSQLAAQEVQAVDQELRDTSARLSELEESVFQTREQFHAKKSRLESLAELQQNLEGYSPSAREILLQLDNEQASATPLGEVLQPEAEIEDHLEMLLGNELNTLLVPSTAQAEGLARKIHERNLERVRVLGLSELSGATPVEIPGAVSLLSRVRIAPGFEAAAAWCLGNAYLCQSADEVFALRRQHPTLTFVSLETKAVGHGDRTISSGTMPTKVGVFARKREMQELEAACVEIESRLTQLSSERENLLQHLQSQEKLHTELKDKLSAAHIESVELRKEREKFQLDLTRTDRDYNSTMRDSERNLAQLEEIQGKIAQWLEQSENLKLEETELAEEVVNIELEIKSTSEDLESLSQGVNESRIEISRLDEKRSGLEYRLEKIRAEMGERASRRESILVQREREDREIEQLDLKNRDIESDKKSSEETRDASVIRIADTKNNFNETCTRLQDLKAEKSELQKQRDLVLTEIQETEIKLAQEVSGLEQLKGISIERYHQEAVSLDETAQIDISQLPLFASQLEVHWDSLPEVDRKILLEAHLKNVREKVGRYGEVNLTAIQEFDDIQKRYDFLMEQKTDLDKSLGILQEAILKIEESTKLRFEETFSAVNSKFKEIFPLLFSGGKAELALTSSENMLEAGVDILVHPPGKRPASITLLSGGEKALTAVSLVLAIFARKPSPFCLLDEVDAPLDDANVSRFNTVVKKMAEKTQFILITHNKKTMEVAQALYGVTMEKAGVSKMTSVRLN